MAELNKCIFIGNVTKEVDLRYTTTGKAVASIGLAVNQTTGRGEERKQETAFINIIAWGKQAENCSQYLEKGKSICVESKVATRSYQNQEGKKVYVTEFIALNIQFLNSSSHTGTTPNSPTEKNKEYTEKTKDNVDSIKDAFDATEDEIVYPDMPNY